MHLVETHAHTSEISPCSRISAHDLAKYYAGKAYAALVITDHYRSDIYQSYTGSVSQRLASFWRGYKLAKKCGDEEGLVVLPGVEICFDGSWSDHLLYGKTEEFLDLYPQAYTMDIRDFYPLAHECGVFVVQAHPFRSGVELSPPQCLDGVEIWNGNQPLHINSQGRIWAQKHDLCMTAGSDCHERAHVASSGMFFHEPLLGMDDLVRQLKNTIVYSERGKLCRC